MDSAGLTVRPELFVPATSKMPPWNPRSSPEVTFVSSPPNSGLRNSASSSSRLSSPKLVASVVLVDGESSSDAKTGPIPPNSTSKHLSSSLSYLFLVNSGSTGLVNNRKTVAEGVCTIWSVDFRPAASRIGIRGWRSVGKVGRSRLSLILR